MSPSPSPISLVSRLNQWRVAVCAGGLLALAAAGSAQARDVHWSIGIQSPGVSVGVSSQAPVVVYPQPVYVYPQPVYQVRPPQRGYVQPVVVYPAAPVAVWGHPGHGHRHGHKHRPDRWDRDGDLHGRHDLEDRRWR